MTIVVNHHNKCLENKEEEMGLDHRLHELNRDLCRCFHSLRKYFICIPIFSNLMH